MRQFAHDHGRRRGAAVQVIATAGHVDHGKSALVRALTGMEPDRWAEERRRGLTIDLGFAWLTCPAGSAWRSSTCRVTSASCRTCWPGSARCPRCCSWWPPTAAGCRSRPSTWRPSRRSASGTACSRSPEPTWPIPARRAPGARPRSPDQPGRSARGRGQRGHRGRAARAAGRAGTALAAAARTRSGRPGPALGRPVVQHQGQWHRRHRHAARRDGPAGQELLLTPSLRPVRIRGLSR